MNALKTCLIFVFFLGCFSACGPSQRKDNRGNDWGKEMSADISSKDMLKEDLLIQSYLDGDSSEGGTVKMHSGSGDIYRFGLGKVDITGSATGMLMMGYVDIKQTTAGIANRQYARIFIFSEKNNPSSLAAIAVLDTCSISIAVREKVVQAIESKTGGALNSKNIMMISTHTHNAPGGVSHYKLYALSTLGFSEFTFDAMVNGTIQAFEKAWANMQDGKIFISNADVKNLNRNRSPASYEQNPADERKLYPYDVNKLMTNLRFVRENGETVGVLNWFAVHATSAESDNRLIDGDNKGYAAEIMEKYLKKKNSGSEEVVAAFASLEAGDSTPNVEGDIDGDGDWDCKENSNIGCIKSSGNLHTDAAKQMMESSEIPMFGGIDSELIFKDMSSIRLEPQFAKNQTGKTTCKAALGISMFAGAGADHAGIGKEGVSCEKMGGIFERLLCKGEVDECHSPKPVVLRLAKDEDKSPWSPDIVPIQIIKIGPLAIAGGAHEYTTMSGRRIKEEVRKAMQSLGVEQVLMASYANGYAGYIATYEEYQLQRYEGASTHYGPWTQAAYQQEFSNLASMIVRGNNSEREQKRKELKPRDTDLSWIRVLRKNNVDREGVVRKNFGDVISQPSSMYKAGTIADALFVGADLDYSLHQGQPIMSIKKYDAIKQTWTDYLDDKDYDLKIHWIDQLFGKSQVRAEWHIPKDTPPGRYKFYYKGKAKISDSGSGAFKEFDSFTNHFDIQPSN